MRPIAAIALTLTLAFGVGAAHTSAAQGADAGDVVVVDAVHRTAEITGGGSATEFTLRLPDGASCPGDSAHDQYRFSSFIIPSTDDPGSMTWIEHKPEGDGARWALYEVNTASYASNFLPENNEIGQPSRIPTIPPLSFAVFDPSFLPSGEYRIGIACLYYKDTTTYWDARILIVEDASDKPGGFTWSVVNPPRGAVDSSDLDDSALGRWLLISGIAIGLAGVAYLYWRRRVRATTPRTKEHA